MAPQDTRGLPSHHEPGLVFIVPRAFRPVRSIRPDSLSVPWLKNRVKLFFTFFSPMVSSGYTVSYIRLPCSLHRPEPGVKGFVWVAVSGMYSNLHTKV